MILFGDDFEFSNYANTELDYNMLDDIIKFINENTEYNAMYSTPSAYFSSLTSNAVSFNYF